ncbi:uncharacterized protein LOC129612615 isoform X2 [Condylostylus longicornis]|uniref:uncharacterized protein LOC129612615 isoform X2 n=1 Tax=Condylostylus longicornis TaxID=2530218 RepID=UPI00244E142C|nr:uncharacterized protein LOC129612615 isoform X2 [Condylostylus longicornis]
MVSIRILNRLLKRGALLTTLFVILFNECLIYSITPAWWNSLKCYSDPQLLGFENENKFYSSLARKDSDRYLKKTFDKAVKFTNPDIICFLGDLLDEGNIASPYHFKIYVDRFQTTFSTQINPRRIHVPGDNDIGGENGEYISNSNIRRFEIEFMHEDLFDFDNRMRFFKINRMLMDFSNPDPMNNYDRIRIGVTHMPLLMSGGPLMRNVLNDLDPHVIFSAHWHESRIFLFPSSSSQELYTNKVLEYDLIKLKDDHEYLEIMIPTASYRMGKMKIGYGSAIFDNNVLRYTVLWNFSRFISLLIYLLWVATIAILCLIFIVIWRCPIRLGKRKNINNNSYIPQL